MHVGIVRISLRIPSSHSLKDRRQVSRSLIHRIRSRFNVSVAQEVAEDGDAWQSVTLLATHVSGDPNHVDVVLNDLVDFIEHARPDLELVHYGTEVISGV